MDTTVAFGFCGFAEAIFLCGRSITFDRYEMPGSRDVNIVVRTTPSEIETPDTKTANTAFPNVYARTWCDFYGAAKPEAHNILLVGYNREADLKFLLEPP